MTYSDSQDSIEIAVTDFGPIAKAKVELRPFTVFVGPSNTGKSYLATLVYALHRYFSAPSSTSGRFFGRSVLSHELLQRSNQKLVNSFEEFLRTEFDVDDYKKKGRLRLPNKLTQALGEAVSSQGVQVGNEVLRCYGVEKLGTLIRNGKSTESRIDLKVHKADHMKAFESRLIIGADVLNFKTVLPEELDWSLNAENNTALRDYVYVIRDSAKGALSEDDEEYRHFLSEAMVESVGDYTLPFLMGPLRRPAFYLPADRTGVMHAHNLVVSALIRNAPMAGLRPGVRTPMLSGVLADFLEQLIALDQTHSRRRGRGSNLGTSIEKGILHGSIRLERSEATGYPKFSYQPEGWKTKLSLMNASSMVSELAPVVLYLRHMVEPGNVLIVEEPEAHLHPAMQVEFTRQLATLVRSGVRVIVTTHSEWLLEELANIVRRSALPESEKAEPSGAGVALNREQVGAWLFEPRQKKPKGSVVKEIHLDESGLYPSGFDDVAAALHNDWAEISSRIDKD